MGDAIQRGPSLKHEVLINRWRLSATRGSVLEHSFYFFMSVLIAIVVLCGFSRTVNTGLIHPPSTRPTVLHFHAVLFTAWVFHHAVCACQGAQCQTPPATRVVRTRGGLDHAYHRDRNRHCDGQTTGARRPEQCRGTPAGSCSGSDAARALCGKANPQLHCLAILRRPRSATLTRAAWLWWARVSPCCKAAKSK